MSAVTIQEPLLEISVKDFLQRHNAEGHFRTAWGLLHHFFPEVRRVEVSLLEDPDEENHAWILLQVFVPLSSLVDSLATRRDRFHLELAEKLSLPYHPFSFCLSLRPERE